MTAGFPLYYSYENRLTLYCTFNEVIITKVQEQDHTSLYLSNWITCAYLHKHVQQLSGSMLTQWLALFPHIKKTRGLNPGTFWWWWWWWWNSPPSIPMQSTPIIPSYKTSNNLQLPFIPPVTDPQSSLSSTLNHPTVHDPHPILALHGLLVSQLV